MDDFLTIKVNDLSSHLLKKYLKQKTLSAWVKKEKPGAWTCLLGLQMYTFF
jgi:hypothetical protein